MSSKLPVKKYKFSLDVYLENMIRMMVLFES